MPVLIRTRIETVTNSPCSRGATGWGGGPGPGLGCQTLPRQREWGGSSRREIQGGLKALGHPGQIRIWLGVGLGRGSGEEGVKAQGKNRRPYCEVPRAGLVW